MVQQQIVDYAKAQLKMGVSKDAIKASLLGAGWAQADIDDSLKAADVAEQPRVVTTPTIMISDLGGNSKLQSMPSASKVDSVAKKEEKKIESPQPVVSSKAGFHKLEMKMIVIVVLAVVALLAAGLGAYLYMQNKSLQNKIATLSGELDVANAKVTSLNTQVEDLNKQAETLKVKNAQLSSDGSKLVTELSFFVVRPDASSAELAFTMKLKVDGGGKVPYTLSNDDGLKLTVKNSKDAKIDEGLKPLVGQTAEVSGTYAGGSRDVMVTAVNGATL